LILKDHIFQWVVAHNLKVVGSNPTPATKNIVLSVTCKAPLGALFALPHRPEALRKQEGAKLLVTKRTRLRRFRPFADFRIKIIAPLLSVIKASKPL
jgi:hypothetical protein